MQQPSGNQAGPVPRNDWGQPASSVPAPPSHAPNNNSPGNYPQILQSDSPTQPNFRTDPPKPQALNPHLQSPTPTSSQRQAPSAQHNAQVNINAAGQNYSSQMNRAVYQRQGNEQQEEESKEDPWSRQNLQRLGVDIKAYPSGQTYYSQLQGQVVWTDPPNNQLVYFRWTHKEQGFENGKAVVKESVRGDWIQRWELVMKRPDFLECQQPFLSQARNQAFYQSHQLNSQTNDMH